MVHCLKSICFDNLPGENKMQTKGRSDDGEALVLGPCGTYKWCLYSLAQTFKRSLLRTEKQVQFQDIQSKIIKILESALVSFVRAIAVME